MHHLNALDPVAAPRHAKASQTNGDAVITIAADPEQLWALDWISWSYSGAPTGGGITIAIGGTTVWEIDITAAGPGHFEFCKPLYVLEKGLPVVITLKGAGASVVGKVNVRYR